MNNLVLSISSISLLLKIRSIITRSLFLTRIASSLHRVYICLHFWSSLCVSIWVCGNYLFPERNARIRKLKFQEYRMIGSLLNRGLVLMFGYAYPAYECFKTVENNADIQQLRFWCQYWILVAVLTVCERIGDTFIPWLPMYSEAKLGLYIYLWYPRTKGTSYVYESFFKPYVSKHETEIDRTIMELKTKAGDILVLYFQRAATYGQTRIFEILQYVASQSTLTPKSPYKQNAHRQEAPPATSTSTPSSQHQTELVQEVSSSTAALAISPAPSGRRLLPAPTNSTSAVKKTAQQSDPAVKKTPSHPVPDNSKQSATKETDSMQIEPVPSWEDNENPGPPPQKAVMGGVIHVTPARMS